MKRSALITGITGQDGIYLANFLIKKGYDVHGLIRLKSSYDRQVISKLEIDVRKNIILHKGNLRSGRGIESIIKRVKPDEIYNLGAISNVDLAERTPVKSYDINFLGVIRILEAVRKFSPKTKVFQAGSLMQFSQLNGNQLSEKSKFGPANIYGKTKQLAYERIKEYRSKYRIFACCGFMSNHDSFLRDGTALSKKIVKSIVRYQQNKISYFCLYNIDFRRDWGHANDYVRAMWLMMQRNIPDDFIIAANNFRSIRDICEAAFKYFGVEIAWSKKGKYDYAKNVATGKILIKSRQHLDCKIQNCSATNKKIYKKLNWTPKIGFEKIISEMIEKELANEKFIKLRKK